MDKQRIKVDIVSDINCPWCYLGETRLKKAIDNVAAHYEFDLAFKPFELNPNAPEQGEPKQEYFLRNYGAEAMPQLNASSNRLTEAGKMDGIVFDFERSAVVHNTFNGHRLIWLAGKYGVQSEVTEALYKANFTDGENVNDTELLKKIGIASGIPSGKLEGFFGSDEGKDEVKQMEYQAQQNGINGVPAFIINDKYLVKGAQEIETFINVFKQVAPVWEEIDNSSGSCATDSSGAAC